MNSNNTPHILIVDDEKFNIEIVAAYLKEEKYKLSFALNAQGTLKTVSKLKIDLILLDISMPDIDGFKLCSMLKSEPKTKDIPIIFLTAHNDIDYIQKAFEVGGVDYINKPFNSVELLARVKTHLQNKTYLEEIKIKQSKLAQLSITDPLTKLNNSLFFETQIKSKLNSKKPFWVMYVKINNFEKINSLYGFHTSNSIIKKFAQLLADTAIPKSIIARLYGVSFAVIIKDYDDESIEDMKKRLFQQYKKSKDLADIFNYSISISHINRPTTLDIVYKNLQTSLKKFQE